MVLVVFWWRWGTQRGQGGPKDWRGKDAVQRRRGKKRGAMGSGGYQDSFALGRARGWQIGPDPRGSSLGTGQRRRVRMSGAPGAAEVSQPASPATRQGTSPTDPALCVPFLPFLPSSRAPHQPPGRLLLPFPRPPPPFPGRIYLAPAALRFFGDAFSARRTRDPSPKRLELAGGAQRGGEGRGRASTFDPGGLAAGPGRGARGKKWGATGRKGGGPEQPRSGEREQAREGGEELERGRGEPEGARAVQ